MSTSDNLKCPSCGRILSIGHEGEQYHIYCTSGSCESVVSNDGAKGYTLEAAYNELCARVHVEEEQAREKGNHDYV